jgi:hypothetical protein
MGKVILQLTATWGAIFLSYIILAVTMPIHNQIATDVGAALSASSNMSNYPGSLGAVGVWPVVAWFIPGGIGIVATAIFLKKAEA